VIPHTATVEEIKARDPQAIVLSGGPASVYADGAPRLDPALFDLNLPVFASATASRPWRRRSVAPSRTPAPRVRPHRAERLGGQLHSELPGMQRWG
jgi:GMP synthase (glutamine-hydrolysing)